MVCRKPGASHGDSPTQRQRGGRKGDLVEVEGVCNGCLLGLEVVDLLHEALQNLCWEQVVEFLLTEDEEPRILRGHLLAEGGWLQERYGGDPANEDGSTARVSRWGRTVTVAMRLLLVSRAPSPKCIPALSLLGHRDHAWGDSVVKQDRLASTRHTGRSNRWNVERMASNKSDKLHDWRQPIHLYCCSFARHKVGREGGRGTADPDQHGKP